MNNFILYILAVLLFINIILLILKLVRRRDLSLTGSVLARVCAIAGIYNYISSGDISFIHVSIMLVLASDITVNVIYLFAYKYILTEKERELSTQLTNLQNKYDIVKEESPVGLYVISTDGTIEFINGYIEKLLGYSRNELLGKSIDTIISANCMHEVSENIRKRVEGKVQTMAYNICFKTKDGSRVYGRVSGSITQNGHKTITGSLVQVDENGKYLWNIVPSS